MKNIFLLAIGVLSTTLTLASQAPYGPDEDARFSALEASTGLSATTLSIPQIASYAAIGHHDKKVAKVIWNPSSVVADRSLGTHSTGVFLPAGAIVTRVFGMIGTAVTSSGGTGTVGLKCVGATATLTLVTANDPDGATAGFIFDGVQTGACSPMVRVAETCAISASVPGAAFTAGKIDYFIETVIAE